MDMLRLLMNPAIRDSATKMAAAFQEAGIDMSKVRALVVCRMNIHLPSSMLPLGHGAVAHDGGPQETSRGQVAWTTHLIRSALAICLFIVLARYHTDFYIVTHCSANIQRSLRTEYCAESPSELHVLPHSRIWMTRAPHLRETVMVRVMPEKGELL